MGPKFDPGEAMLARLKELFNSGTNTYDSSPPRRDEAKQLAADLSKLGPVTAGGGIENQHSVDVESPPLTRICLSVLEKNRIPRPVDPEGEPRSDLGWRPGVPVLSDPPARRTN
jgi:hypothetical protein